MQENIAWLDGWEDTYWQYASITGSTEQSSPPRPCENCLTGSLATHLAVQADPAWGGGTLAAAAPSVLQGDPSEMALIILCVIKVIYLLSRLSLP